ncbi:protein OSB1, mitochondrial-like [Populus nigra]|uniref:protein OSB1, mitochondrial-like n=1 Tax=Populus nigra TaxID=3691 RepID=UPI002B27A606|nr:protein OSB1, mitochondrial-like [Populus nigra]
MIKPYRIGFLIRNLSRFSLQRLAPFSSSSAANLRFSNSSTDEDELDEINDSAVYRHTISTQRPSTVEWKPSLVNLVRFIGTVDRSPIIYKTKGGGFGCYTLLYARDPHDSNRWFRILVETWCEMAKMCIQHVKPNDIIYVSGHLESYLSFDRTGNPSSSYKIIANELCYIAQHNQRSDCQSLEEPESETCLKFKEPESSACQKYTEPYSGAGTGMENNKNHLCLWKAFFSSPHEWWDNRKFKKNSKLPDFKHKISGDALWLRPDDPLWIKTKLQLLDWKAGEHCEEERHKNHLYLWQVFFASPHEWWDNRKNKKNSVSPDFKHKDTGEALWLSPNDPPWVKRQIQLLDLSMAVQHQERGAGPRVSHWVYED